jgi:hypothetical protein
MTDRDDIIRMARKAGASPLLGGETALFGDAAIERFAALVIAEHESGRKAGAAYTEMVAEIRSDDAAWAAMKEAVKSEREACEKACDQLRGTVSMFATVKDTEIHNNAVSGCIAAIRARGESK